MVLAVLSGTVQRLCLSGFLGLLYSDRTLRGYVLAVL